MTTVYRGAAVHDGTGAPPVIGDLVVEGGRIRSSEHVDPAASVVDVSGRGVIPGLIDCHTHVTLPTLDPLRLMNTPLSRRFLETGRTLATTLDLGITTVRDAGGADAGIAQAVADGVVAARECARPSP